MMGVTDEVTQIDISIEEARKAIERKNALSRLLDNGDFRLVIEEGYFEKEAAELVIKKATPGMASPENQESIIKAIDAVGGLYQYLFKVFNLGEQAEKSLEIHEQTRTDIVTGGM